jgi:hypothetical protein
MLYKKVDAASPNSVSAALGKVIYFYSLVCVLDLFSTPPTNCAVSNSMWRIYNTLNPIK